jgi:hypothetical protein
MTMLLPQEKLQYSAHLSTDLTWYQGHPSAGSLVLPDNCLPQVMQLAVAGCRVTLRLPGHGAQNRR